MLSNKDLQRIQKIVQTAMTNAVEKETANSIDGGITPLKKDIKILKSAVTQIRTDMKTIFNIVDNESIDEHRMFLSLVN
jgi:hypothetical protein